MNSITIQKTLSGRGLWVSGETFPHMTQLKSMGGKWNASKKSWIFSLKKQNELLDYFNLRQTDIGSSEPIAKTKFQVLSSNTQSESQLEKIYETELETQPEKIYETELETQSEKIFVEKKKISIQSKK